MNLKIFFVFYVDVYENKKGSNFYVFGIGYI